MTSQFIFSLIMGELIPTSVDQLHEFMIHPKVDSYDEEDYGNCDLNNVCERITYKLTKSNKNLVLHRGDVL